MADNELRDEEKRKKLINETITGRRITPGRFIRMALTAALCGIVFAAAALIVIAVAGHYYPGIKEFISASGGEAALEESLPQEIPSDGTGEAVPDEGDSAIPDEVPEETAEKDISGGEDEADGSRDRAGEEAPDDGSGGYAGESAEDAEESTTENSGDASEMSKLNNDEKSPEEDLNREEPPGGEGLVPDGTGSVEIGEEGMETGEGSRENIIGKLCAERKEALSMADACVVSVSAISTGKTWFENIVSNSTEYSGLIVDIGEDEILVLTAADAAGSETLKVTFGNSVSVDAYVKQSSAHDNLCVLAVSAVSGLDQDMLSKLRAAEFSDDAEIFTGQPVIAAGSPLGVTGSNAFGDIGYIEYGHPGYDTEECVIYADISADPEKVTFLMDYSGRLLGVMVREDAGGLPSEKAAGFISAASLGASVESLKNGEEIAYIGIEGVSVDFDMHYNGMPEGVYAAGIESGSPAYTAGLLRGDIIFEADNEPVTDAASLCAAVRKHKPGEEILLKVYRAGTEGEYSEISYTFTAGTR